MFIGSRLPSELLVSLVDDPLIMDELISQGLLIKDGDDLRFRHEIARVAIEAAVPPYRKAAIHTKIMDALLASGCDDNARLAFHAEGAGRDDLVVRYGSRAGQRASELAAHREAAAQYARALRSAMATDIRTRAELSDALAQELALVDRWEESAEMRTAALELWREAGDLRRESQSLLRLSVAMWRLCRGAESKQARELALALAQDGASVPDIARAYERIASHRVAEARYEEAIAMAREVREMAEQLGLTDVISDALDTEAKAIRGMAGEWAVPMQAALGSALSGGHEEQAGRAFARAYSWYCDDLRPDEAERCYGDAFAYCEAHDIGTFVVCLQGQRTAVLEQSGRWDECISLGHALLDQHRLSPWNRLRPLCSTAKVMARRRQQGFWPYLDEAMESALRLGEPEWIRPVGIARSEAYWLEGRLDAAISELDRVRSFSAGATAVENCWMALWLRRLSGTADAVDIQPFASQLAGDGARAAMLWDRLGCPYQAALALMDTNEETHLRESLARLVDLGADATARLVRRTMRDLGIRSIPAGARTTTRAHPRVDRTRAGDLRTRVQGESNEEISAACSFRSGPSRTTCPRSSPSSEPLAQRRRQAGIKLGLSRPTGSVLGATKSR